MSLPLRVTSASIERRVDDAVLAVLDASRADELVQAPRARARAGARATSASPGSRRCRAACGPKATASLPAALARAGTGSYPERPHGWQRPSRFAASQTPRAHAVALERFGGVLRAGGLVAALEPKPRRQRELIEANEAEQQRPDGIGRAHRDRRQRAPPAASSMTMPRSVSSRRMRSASANLRLAT